METTERRGVGRPRSETARKAILLAALELASEQGDEGLTMNAIAKSAGVSKETLYRWWRSKSEVLLEALADLGERAIQVPDGGTLESDLRAFMRATARTLDAPTRRLLRTLAAAAAPARRLLRTPAPAAAADAAFADEVRERFLHRRRIALATLLERAVRRGE